LRRSTAIALQQAGLAQLFGAPGGAALFDPDIGAQIDLGLPSRARRRDCCACVAPQISALFRAERCCAGLAGRGLAAGQLGWRGRRPDARAGSPASAAVQHDRCRRCRCPAARADSACRWDCRSPGRVSDARVLQVAWHAEQVLGRSPASPLMQLD
jgi:aspartyl-tRNA(Asn)/glutamyl-tRNA(Gln) amidotransferase subunit A